MAIARQLWKTGAILNRDRSMFVARLMSVGLLGMCTAAASTDVRPAERTGELELSLSSILSGELKYEPGLFLKPGMQRKHPPRPLMQRLIRLRAQADLTVQIGMRHLMSPNRRACGNLQPALGAVRQRVAKTWTLSAKRWPIRCPRPSGAPGWTRGA